MVIFTLQNFYKSKEWEMFRNAIIGERTNKKDGVLYCEHCGKPIIKAYDVIIHHIEELTPANVNDRLISLNPANVMVVHHRCHNQIHKRFGYNRATPRKVYIVYGPPLAGKSSWVREAAGEKDLILDVDRIWQMISNNPEYTKPTELKVCVFDIRDTIIDMVKTRRGKWTNAYIIGGYPSPRERQELATALNAELIPIIEPKEECLNRLTMATDGRDKKEWRKYIADWFDRAG